MIDERSIVADIDAEISSRAGSVRGLAFWIRGFVVINIILAMWLMVLSFIAIDSARTPYIWEFLPALKASLVEIRADPGLRDNPVVKRGIDRTLLALDSQRCP